MSNPKPKPAKPKDDTAKIIDVSKPGKAKPSPTSKEVIVTNRPVLKDPMVVDSIPDDKAKDGVALQASTRVSIKPLSDEEKADSAEPKPADTPKPEEQAAVQPAADAETPDKKPESAAESGDAKAEDAKASDSAPPDQASAKKPEPQPKPAEEASTGKEESSDADAGENNGKPKKTTEEDEEKAAKAAAEHEAQLEKIVDSRQYYVPINAVEKRKNKRVALLGILVILLLAAAWVDLALDAGLIHIDHIKPITHFFSTPKI